MSSIQLSLGSNNSTALLLKHVIWLVEIMTQYANEHV